MKKLNISDTEYKASEKDDSATIAKVVTSSKPSVGIWWLVRGECYAFQEDPKQCPQGRIVSTEKEHSRVFHVLQKLLAPQIPEIESVRHGEVERGRVWYIPSSKGYMITCSTEISVNPEALKEIKKAFGILGEMVQVRVESQYDVFEIKVK